MLCNAVLSILRDCINGDKSRDHSRRFKLMRLNRREGYLTVTTFVTTITREIVNLTKRTIDPRGIPTKEFCGEKKDIFAIIIAERKSHPESPVNLPLFRPQTAQKFDQSHRCRREEGIRFGLYLAQIRGI